MNKKGKPLVNHAVLNAMHRVSLNPPSTTRFLAQHALNKLRQTSHNLRNHGPPAQSPAAAKMRSVSNAEKQRIQQWIQTGVRPELPKNRAASIVHGVTQRMLNLAYANDEINQTTIGGKLTVSRENLNRRWHTFSKRQKATVLVHHGFLTGAISVGVKKTNDEYTFDWYQDLSNDPPYIALTRRGTTPNTYTYGISANYSNNLIKNSQPGPSKLLHDFLATKILGHATIKNNGTINNNNSLSINPRNYNTFIDILSKFNHQTLDQFWRFIDNYNLWAW